MEPLSKAVDIFDAKLSTERDLKRFLTLLRKITRRFALLEEDNTLSGCFAILQGLAEQYHHELLVSNNVPSVGVPQLREFLEKVFDAKSENPRDIDRREARQCRVRQHEFQLRTNGLPESRRIVQHYVRRFPEVRRYEQRRWSRKLFRSEPGEEKTDRI